MVLLRTIRKTLAGLACVFVGLLVPMASAQIVTEPMPLPEGITATGDTLEVRALYAWAEASRYRNPSEAEQVALRALTLARELNDQRGIGLSLIILGNLAHRLSQQEMYYMAAQQVFEKIGDERGLIRSRLNMDNVYELRGELDKALKTYFDALQDLVHLGELEGQTVVLNSIGLVHESQGNLEEALTFYEQALLLAETLDNPGPLLHVLNNFGNALSKQGSYNQAEAHLRRALTTAEEWEYRILIAMTSNNLGVLLNKQGRHEHALPFLFVAERLAEELGENRGLSFVYNELAIAHMGLGQYDRALHYAHESLVLAHDIGLVYEMVEIYQTLSHIYEAIGDPVQALTYYRLYAATKFNAERVEIISEMQTRYETEEKQRAIERLEQENQIQMLRASRRQTLLLGGIVITLLIAGLFYNRYRLKRREHHLLAELDVAKSRFFANISHEFRTPLTVILGSMQDALAGRFGSTTEKLTEQLQAALRNTQQLQRLINEVLDLNRLESGHLELQPTPGDLVRFLKHLVEANAPLAERNGITLTLACEVESCPRLYDEEKLEKIVGNLLSNALKFTPRDGTVRVDLRCEDQVEISVTDNGPGVSPEEQANVFERFVQLDHGLMKGGTGIGLALAKELTQLHGGSIALESAPDKGSTFTVRLPLERATLMAVQEGTTRHFRSIEAFETGGDEHAQISLDRLEDGPDGEEDQTTVLIIEDNDDVRAYVRRSLEGTYRVLEAIDGESGLHQAHEALPDLIVSDVMLPDTDGYEIARQLKTTPEIECIPVVMLTARAAEGDHVTGYESGAEAYITKPFFPETLRAVIARLLEERKRLRRQLQAQVKRIEGISPNGHSAILDRVRSAVLENLHEEDFDVGKLAFIMGMSRPTLNRHVKQETGFPPSDLIRILRLEQAHELLLSGQGSVSEIAYAVGFKSLSHFTHSFRKHYGELPSSVLETRI